MKIRFYHRWIYRLFLWSWTPIWDENPAMVRDAEKWMQGWLDRKNRGEL